jgi:Tfp pilus assembly protein PilF
MKKWDARKHVNLAFLLSLLLGMLAVPPSGYSVQLRQGDVSSGIHGEVRYSQGGGTAENVLVELELVSGGLLGQVRTDRTGKFGFASYGSVIYRVTASLEGFEPASQIVDLTVAPAEYVILTLVPHKSQIPPKPPLSGTLSSAVPKEALNEFDLGKSQLLSGSDPATAISHLEKAVSIYPDFLQAHLLLGTAYMDMHQTEKAEASLKRVLAIDPKTQQALMALGELYREKRNYPEAEKMLQEGLRLNDSSWQAHLALGRLYWQMADLPKAGAEVGRALQLNSLATDAYLLAGNIFLKANKTQEALQMYMEYLKLAPSGPYAEETRKIVERIEKASGKANK